MELQSRDAPLPPFFAAVRRRHPEVDIVVLPPESAPPLREPTTDHRLAGAVDLTTGTTTRIWAAAVADGQVPDTRFAFGPDPETVVVRSRVSARLEVSVLPSLVAALAQDGWEVGERPGAVSQVFARRRSTQLVASYAEETGTFIVTVTSAPLPVGVDRARELARH